MTQDTPKRTIRRNRISASITYAYPLDDDGQDAVAAMGPGWRLVAVDGAGRVYHFDRSAPEYTR